VGLGELQVRVQHRYSFSFLASEPIRSFSSPDRPQYIEITPVLCRFIKAQMNNLDRQCPTKDEEQVQNALQVRNSGLTGTELGIGWSLKCGHPMATQLPAGSISQPAYFAPTMRGIECLGMKALGMKGFRWPPLQSLACLVRPSFRILLDARVQLLCLAIAQAERNWVAAAPISDMGPI
jgi:hypothetical protein